MPSKTRYKRSTWKKQQLQQNMNTPRLGNKACHLCPSGSGDQSNTNLNAHVSDSQTCADIHLQLSLLRYDNAMCSVGQEQYGEICCTEPPSSSSSPLSLKSSVFVVGAVIVGLCLRNKFQQSGRRTTNDSSSSSDNESKKHKRRQKQDHQNHHSGPPMYVPNAKMSGNQHCLHQQQRPHRHQQQMIGGNDDGLELPTAYRRMEDVNGIVAIPSPIVPTRSRSRSRPKSRSRSRPKSRSRTAARRDEIPTATASASYEHMEEGIVQPSRPRSRPKSRTRSRSKSRPTSRTRAAGRSSSRGRTNRRQPDYTVTASNALVVLPKTPTQLV
mmetsp:Transcript_18151/g.43887  ORF Transcript_18151/g.43887 Transcript_18151/m.43887 type:complete len:327 (+) Transcript_18151:177-1157(+)